MHEPTNAIVTVTHTLDIPASRVARIIDGAENAEQAVEKAVIEDTPAFMDFANGDPDVEVAL
jgi:hypothetical protein